MTPSKLVQSGRSLLVLFSVFFAIAFAGVLAAPSSVFADGGVNIGVATGGESVSIDTSSASSASTYTPLEAINISESAPGQITAGTHIISLPSGWEFNTSAHIMAIKGDGLTLSSYNITPDASSFSFTVVNPSSVSTFLVLSGMEVRPAVTNIADANGDMTHSGASIDGVVDGTTSFGTLSTVPGTVVKLAFSQQPGGAVYGSALSPQPVVVTQDQFGNNSANGAAGKTAAMVLSSGSGSVSGTAALDISSGTASFAGLKVNTIGAKQFTVSADGLAPAVSNSFEITQKPITTTLTANDKEYDGGDLAVITGGVLNGVEDGDSVTVDLASAVATFSDQNVGLNKTVTATGVILAGPNAENYTLGNVTGTADITARPITITADAKNKTYGDTDPALTYQITSGSLIGSDTLAGSLSRAPGEDVNSYSIMQGTLNNANYAITFVPANLVISQKPLTVTATGASNKVYDATTDAVVTLSDNRISGDTLVFGYTASFSDKNIGTGKAVSVTGISITGGADAGNYVLSNTTTSTTANITVKPLTVSFTTDANKTYSGTTQANIHRSDGTLVLDGVIGAEVVNVADGSASFADKHVGNGKTVTATGFTLTGADKDNYVIGTVNPTTGNIIARLITVTAATNNKTYDGTTSSAALPTITSGSLATGDTASFTQTYDTKNVGENKALTPGGLVDDGNSGNNYTVTSVSVSTGEITEKTIDVTAQPDTKAYNGTTASGVAPIVGALEIGDTVTTAPTQAFSTKDVGTGKTLAASGLVINDGNGGLNYDIHYVNNTAGVINVQGLTVVGATSNSKVYNGNTTAIVNFGAATLAGVVPGEEALVTLNSAGYSATFDNKNVGAGKIVTVAGLALAGAGAGNYSLTQPILMDGVITPAPLTVTAAGVDKVYDAGTSATVTLSSDKFAEDVLTLGGTASFADKNVGDDKPVSVAGITVTGTDAGNYTLGNTTAATMADITQAPLSATVTVENKVVDGNTSAAITSRTLVGVISGDVVTANTDGVATFASATVGTHAISAASITLAGADKDNYDYNGTATGTGNILPVPEVVYVDGGWTEISEWADPDGEGPATAFGYDAFVTIQEGVDAVVTDGTVNVAAGTYAESVTVNKSIILSGASNTTTIIQPAIDQNGVYITADEVLVKDLRINTSNSGTEANIAIRIEGASGVEINNNVIETTGDKAMGIWIGGIGYENSNDLTITENTITINNESTGIYAEGGSIAQSGWQITNNTVTANSGNPIELYDVTNSTISGNTLTTTSVGGSNVMWFSELSNLSNLVFNNNIMSGSSGSEVAIGTDFRNDGPFAGSPASSITTVTISGNTFSDWGSRALRIGHFGLGTVSGVTVSGNKFLVGTQTETLSNTDVASVNAEANWWGDATGPAENAVIGAVEYRPWCVEESCTTVDIVAPVPTITSSAGTLTNASPIPFSVAFGESVAGFEIGDVTVGNGTPNNFSGSGAAYTFDVTPAGQGAVTVNIAGSVAWDASGNYNTVAAQYSITYDSIAPIAEITSGTPASPTNETTTNITVVGTGVVTYQYKLDDGSYSADTPIATHITLSGLDDGVHTLYVRGRDAAGNLQAEPGTATATWTVDTQEPVIAITAPLAGSSVNGSGEIAFTNDSDSTPTVAECSINDSAPVVCMSGTTTLDDVTGFGALDDGNFTLNIRDTDAAGNIGTASVALVKDTLAPSVTSKTPGVNALNVDPNADITIVFNESIVAGETNVTLFPDTAFTITVSGGTLTIHPTNPLANNTVYDVTLSSITDEAGNELGDDVSWSFTTATSYAINLVANSGGWNLISLPINPIDTNTGAILGDDPSAIDAVWTYDPENENADETGWLVYHPNTPDDLDLSNLRTMKAGYGYWVSVTADATLSGSGSLLSARQVPPSRTLSSGWNLLGYYQIPGEPSSDMDNAFSSIGLAGVDYTSLWGFDNVSGTFKNVEDILPGDAFWISVPEDGKVYTPSNLNAN